VTLIVTVNGPETLWMLADRRLSSVGRAPSDDACKIIQLQTNDGVALLGYAGLGSTASGTEISDWMSAVLRGRNIPLVQAIGVLAGAMKQQLPRHMENLPGPGGPIHNMIITTFLGSEARVYTIDLAFAPDRKSRDFSCNQHVTRAGKAPRLVVAGSGALYLDRDKKWIRRLLRVVRAHDRGQVTPNAVADHLASLNHEVHLGTKDKSVGPSCIVTWQYRKDGANKGGGGVLSFDTAAKRERGVPALPRIWHGGDVSALVAAMLPHWKKTTAALLADQPAPEPDRDAINADLARLPDEPDDELR
jgi:hypothetical protein